MSESKSSELDLSKLKISRDRGVAPAVSRRRYGKRIFIAVLILLLVAGLIARNVMAPVEVETATVSMAYRAQSYTLLNATGYVVAQRKAAVASAKAALQEVTGSYEEKVLTAFKEVETLMATLFAQEAQLKAQKRLQAAADSASKLARQRYAEGVTTYLEVIEADRTALSSRRGMVQLHSQQLLTTVQLIKALGGGWKAAK